MVRRAAARPSSNIRHSAALFVIELILPFLIFGPRRLRFVAAFGFLCYKPLFLATGNYNWFNFQTMILCLLLFDDSALAKVVPGWLTRLIYRRTQSPHPNTIRRIVVGALAILIVFSSLLEMDRGVFGGALPDIAQEFASAVAPWRIAHAYGLFAIMTTKREEIVIEGSDDNLHWREYEFRYKPGEDYAGAVMEYSAPASPGFGMWFAALDYPSSPPWFWNFLQRLLQGDLW